MKTDHIKWFVIYYENRPYKVVCYIMKTDHIGYIMKTDHIKWFVIL